MTRVPQTAVGEPAYVLNVPQVVQRTDPTPLGNLRRMVNCRLLLVKQVHLEGAWLLLSDLRYIQGMHRLTICRLRYSELRCVF